MVEISSSAVAAALISVVAVAAAAAFLGVLFQTPSQSVARKKKKTEELVEYSGSKIWWACEPDANVKPRVAAKGVASLEGSPPTTLMSLMKAGVETKGHRQVLKVERNLPPMEGNKAPGALPDSDWTTWTMTQWYDDSRAAAKAMIKLGFERFDSVNIWGFNSPEWVIAAAAAGFAGGKCAGLYPTDTPDTAGYKVVHSGGSVVVLEDRSKLDKLVKALNARGDCKRVKAFVGWGFDPADGETIDVCSAKIPVFGWKAFITMGKSESDDEINKRVSATEPGHCAALIYTSGTTGEPKAVMISHDNIIFESVAVLELLVSSCGYGEEPERILSYLPLSHVAGFLLDVCCPLVAFAKFPNPNAYLTVYFARPYDLKIGTIKDRLVASKPTAFLGVPLVWEKIADKVRAVGASKGAALQSVSAWAKSVGLEHARSLQLGGDCRKPWGYSFANGAIFPAIKASLGLDKCKFAFTGAAPIRVDTLEYFGSLGTHVNEVYGMSECTGACTWSLDECHSWGSCGFELPGMEVKAFIVDPVDLNKKKECKRAPSLDNTAEEFQGELCFRGRAIMMGYLAQPDLGSSHVEEIKQKNAETIDEDGWLHSGDKGMITEAGMVKITGRYKELIIGDGGENIAPVPIEDCVKKNCDGVCEVMMVGDKRKYNVALVTLKAVGANGESPGTNDLDAGAKRINPEVKTITAAMDDKVWIDTITAAIQAANNNSKICPNNAFKIQKFTILPTNFSELEGELTPTKKLKRPVVTKKYNDLIEALYASEGSGYVRMPN